MKVVNDIEIVEISREDILTNLAEYTPSERHRQNSTFNELVKKYGEPYYLNRQGQTIRH